MKRLVEQKLDFFPFKEQNVVCTLCEMWNDFLKKYKKKYRFYLYLEESSAKY